MNPYVFEVTCSICGEGGMGTARTSAAQWFAESTIYHRDPRVCAENLKRKKIELEKKEAELNKLITAL